MTDATSNTAAEAVPATTDRKRAPAANFLPIVRGRLSLLLVHAIRFDEVISAMANKDIAVKFGTSIGKVFDIKKGRNFAYVLKEYKPTAEDVSAAKAWAAQFGGQNTKGLATTGDRDLIEKIVAQYEARGLGSAADAAKLTEARTANRKPREPKPATNMAAPGTASVATGAELLS